MWAAEGPARAAGAAAGLPSRFGWLPEERGLALPVRDDGIDAGLAAEERLLAQAAAGRALARLWQAPAALVVPRSYAADPGFAAASAASAARGWPVRLRLSGGGVVPQGPGVLNLSLACPSERPAGEASEAVYRQLCGLLQQALAVLGLQCTAQGVDGSFCDGRFNLACAGRKLAGTAQYWRRTGPGRQVVLAHAVLLVDADSAALASCANAFEAGLRHGRFYRAEALVSVAEALVHRGASLPARGVLPALAGVLYEVLEGRLPA